MSLIVEHRDALTVITINRPERRNAIDRETASLLANSFRAFDRDESQQVAILTGSGGNFCAGADLKAIAEGDFHRLEPDGDGPLGPTRMTMSKPVLAAIAGSAVGGGFELALWCDLRIMEENASLGFLERRWGVPLIDGGTVRLPRLIGLSRALDLIITGRAVTAAEALSIGLVHRIVQPGTVLEQTEMLAREIMAFPQVCMRNDRLSTIEQANLSFEDAIRNEFQRGWDALQKETLHGASQFAGGKGRHGTR